jgi:hypothetical protein
MEIPVGRVVASATSRARMRTRKAVPSGSARCETRSRPPGKASSLKPKVRSCPASVMRMTAPASASPVSGASASWLVTSSSAPDAAIFPSANTTSVSASRTISAMAWVT